MTQKPNYKYELLAYKNSGDTKYGDKKRVVGYGALRVYSTNDEFFLTKEEKKQLLEIAKLAIYEAVINNKKVFIDESRLSAKLKLPLGAFVTLYKKQRLRGCIGRFEPNEPLYSVVVDMAIAAAFNDPRFQKVIQEELENIELEISVLTPRKKINSLDEIVIGKHGIYIQKGEKTGTFLPHVATDMNWGVKKFVEECATSKAGITKEEIIKAELFTYEAIVFH
jgi:AmmeMemoRadiSam system protein A